MQARAKDLLTRLAGDLDEAARDSSGTDDPLSRALALAANVDAISAAGDHFEAARPAELIVAQRDKWNLLDPQEAGFDAAIDSWIHKLPAYFIETAFCKAFFDVHRCYLCVLGRRAAFRGTDPKRAEDAFRLVMADKAETDELDIASESSRQQKLAYAELASE